MYAIVQALGDPTQEVLVGTHEVYEASTDTVLGQGWNVPNQQGGEVCDLCQNAGIDVVSGYDVAKVWSVAQGVCE